MQMKMRPRYYCDHCKKGNGSPSAMRRHESSCTMNPVRACRFCGHMGPVAERAALLLVPGDDWKAKMKALREATEECPGCILAAIRQSGVENFDVSEAPDAGGTYEFPFEAMFWNTALGYHAMLGFNFKDEAKSYLNERALSRVESYSYC